MKLSGFAAALTVVAVSAVQAFAGGTPSLEEALQGLGSPSRTTILHSVERLSELNDSRALPALEALLAKRLRSELLQPPARCFR